MLHKISVLVIVLMSVACMKLQKKGEPGESPNAEAKTEQNSKVKDKDGFDFDYDFTESAQKVVFHIPPQWGQVLVERSVKNQRIFQREIDQKTWSDYLDTETVNYKFYQKKGEGLPLLKEIDIIPALDLQISNDTNLSELYKFTINLKKLHFKKLTLMNGARIFIGDFKGQIVIENLDSEDGILQTFAEGAQNQTENGRSVGGFKLDIKTGRGNLKINLFAEAGAHGLPANPPDISKKGPDGAAGSLARFEKVVVAINFDQLFPSIRVPYACTVPPGSSGDGGNGLSGYNGNGGKNGGSVEKIQIVNSSTNLEIVTNFRFGSKGIGSAGGPGGQPGSAGKVGDGSLSDLREQLNLPAQSRIEAGLLAGAYVVSTSCAPGHVGKDGNQGGPGLKGEDGVDGQIY